MVRIVPSFPLKFEFYQKRKYSQNSLNISFNMSSKHGFIFKGILFKLSNAREIMIKIISKIRIKLKGM
jgi:hypothetical protein